ncbi:MAG: hypothetical protein A2Y10_18670 [Planctomycetes bacterium GWF2_41_51]|nr:MAG: hypothetical protein A2Y10_18670 [Planctomycetes bacterium GWF2_41_51]HBG27128.1 hypothetical protein [Phycisphaerales bacterium]
MKKALFLFSIVTLTATMAMGQLAGYWKFDEGTGTTTADSSGNNKNGSFYTAGGGNYPQWTTGANGTGGALIFNANTNGASNSNRVVVALTGSEALANLGEGFTISMWVRRDVVTGVQWPSIIYTDAYEYDLATYPDAAEISTDSHEYFYCDLSSNWQLDFGISTSEQKILGSWYHLAITYDGNFLRKYVNGVLTYIKGAPTSFSLSATTDLLIGGRSDDVYFTGALDDVAIWSGKYLSSVEVAKLANGTVTPLTVVESNPNDPIPPSYYTKETDIAWPIVPGRVPECLHWRLLWEVGFSEAITLNADNTATSWAIDSPLIAGSRSSLWDMNKWFFRNLNDYTHPAKDKNKFGIEWIDPAWSGFPNNIAKFAIYITPGISICQDTLDRGYQLYRPELYPWENKAYFQTYARVAAVNAGNAKMRVKIYTYPNSGNSPVEDPTVLTYLDEVHWPLYYAGNYQWQEFKYAFPKPIDGNAETKIWVEISILDANPNTILYIDEFNPISGEDLAFKAGDIDKSGIVYYEDIAELSTDWLDGIEGLMEPRDGGLLTNADFSEDMTLIPAGEQSKLDGNPTGWTFTGDGNYGLVRTAQYGLMNNFWTVNTKVPLGGSVSAYTTDMTPGDPYGVLKQTASANAVAGQTYYAMGYVLGSYGASTSDDAWTSYNDTATMSIAIDGVEKASFSRVLPRHIWRPIYGTYTALPADAGKSIEIRFSYANTNVRDWTAPGNMYIGNAYLGTTMPQEWPDGRNNKLVNGGFEDLSVLDANIPEGTAKLARYLRTTSNWGAWYLSGMPALPGWIYEVPAGFDLNNKGGMWAGGVYAPPLPSTGMYDVLMYAGSDLILGQIVGALTAGTTYYLDMAAGVSIEHTQWGAYDTPWQNPVPKFHIELWRIPAGVTDGATIHTGITTLQPGYVKISSADVNSTGDIKGEGFAPPRSKWQLIGTSYTAASADTNVYLRVYGTNSVTAPHPSFAFSDVYLSTQKRKVPGGSLTFNISPAMQYEVLGPYDCYHAGLMGLDAPLGDVDDNCVVNLRDFAALAENWVEDLFPAVTP